MDFIERLEKVGKSIQAQKEKITTEEATKHALILPFLQNVLGYNVFDPDEVIPEFTADTGIKKGEKVDYALIKDNAIQIIIECKKLGSKLSVEHAGQLFRYFSVTQARIAILTNGAEYQFFTDLDEKNKMDRKPFLILDLENLDPHLVPELKKMTKTSFDISAVLNSAEDLKYINEIKRFISKQFNNELDDDFVKLVASKVYDGKVITQKVRNAFEKIIAKALKQFMNDKINMRLESAIAVPEKTEIEEVEDDYEGVENGVVTTQEELDAFNIVKAILRKHVDVKRIHHRDKKTYFGILLDDNNRKPICRLHFNTNQKYLGLFDGDNKDDKIAIDSIDDIFNYSERLVSTLDNLQ